ncbi:MAG: hypothetical protein AAGB51_08090 [Planctomycetota bacterium]
MIEIPFLARSQELQNLRDRCAEPGLTVVTGRPRIGKSRLLKRFVELTQARGEQHIGIATASAAQGDVLLRAIEDAYRLWLADASAADQLRAIHEQLKGKYISRVGTALGETLSSATGGLAKPIEKMFSGLRDAQKMLETGGLTIPKLQPDEAKDLLSVIAHRQSKPVVLVLNQWEATLDLQLDRGTLSTFLDEIQEWPAAHIVLHVRHPQPEHATNTEAQDIADQLAGMPCADRITIEELVFEEGDDSLSRGQLIGWIREHFKALGELEDDELLELVDGQPGVLEQWAQARPEARQTLEDYRRLKTDAQGLRYPELPAIYKELLDESKDDAGRARLEVAILAAVAPVPTGPDFERVKPAFLGSMPERDLALLESAGLLSPEPGNPLGLGHPTRSEAAARCVLGDGSSQHGAVSERLKPHVRNAVERLICELPECNSTEAMRGLLDESRIASSVVAGLADLALDLGVRPRAVALSQAAVTLFWGSADPKRMCIGTAEADVIGANGRFMLARGLFNAFNRSEAGSSEASSLLSALRDLAKSRPEDGAVREELARGLFNAFCDSEAGSSEASSLLSELRDLSELHPGDGAVREPLARGLFNAFCDSEAGSSEASSLLSELRDLSKSHPEDCAVREELARGLFNAFNRSEAGSSEASSLLSALRDLAKSHPEDGAVRENVALVSALLADRAVVAGDLEAAAQHFEELAEHPRDFARLPEAIRQRARQRLAKAIGDAPDKQTYLRLKAVSQALFPDPTGKK